MQQGIDINQALSILSARSKAGVTEEDETSCPCCHGTVPAQEHRLGQTIDLGRAEKETVEEQKTSEKDLQSETSKRNEEIKENLESMSEAELVKTVFSAQEDRVKTYREYETALVAVLQSGNISSYPGTVLAVTASFSVLSDTIRAAQKILDNRKETDISQLIDQLQKYEKEKLNLTASFHLERIRMQNEEQQASQDTMTKKLLKDGVKSLERKINTCVERINEVLDELRCSLIDLN